MVHVQPADGLDDLLQGGSRQAPACSNTRMPSRKAMRVGIELIWAAADSSRSASVSTLAKTTSSCCSLAFS
ncbi:hypothetical protein BJF81_08875 [Ornithinimicrobium sp. CNJ-824]|nr:hypothetical protein BJF81_08875 [Ornithinimicrobium sp. CNJ-824]